MHDDDDDAVLSTTLTIINASTIHISSFSSLFFPSLFFF